MDPINPMDNQNPTSDPDNTGKNDQILTDDELNNLSEEELRAQLKTTMYQKKHFREKFSKADEELQKLKGAVAPTTTPANPQSPAPAPQPTVQSVDVESAARKVAMDLKRDEILSGLPEDKRTTVKEFYNAITNGKTIEVSDLNTYMEAAMRAAGVETKINTANRISSSSPGSVPPRQMAGPTPEQIEFARKVGNDPAKVYGEKIDTSAFLNGDKFFTPENKELI